MDTNIIPRHVLQDHPNQARRATALFQAIERGDRSVRLADVVVFEVVFTLETSYRVPRAAIRDTLQPIIDLPGVVLPGKRAYQTVFDLFVRESALSFADCYLAVLARRLGLSSILSFDQKLSRAPGVNRAEPS